MVLAEADSETAAAARASHRSGCVRSMGDSVGRQVGLKRREDAPQIRLAQATPRAWQRASSTSELLGAGSLPFDIAAPRRPLPLPFGAPWAIPRALQVRARVGGARRGGEAMPGIRVKEGESIESALKRFKKATEKAGSHNENGSREHAEGP